jgi:outer membrane protein OmpA-like peptidoglycan-associated protein
LQRGALQFPVGQHVLLPQNYSLLAKVQRAIGAFGEPHVNIEGHTDSTGSTELNERLSQARAEAVRDYLVANRTLPAEKVTAIGRGFSDPLASDRTELGRAMNRRIDVIIDARQAGERLAEVAGGS